MTWVEISPESREADHILASHSLNRRTGGPGCLVAMSVRLCLVRHGATDLEGLDRRRRSCRRRLGGSPRRRLA
jgi:hypothetical protein